MEETFLGEPPPLLCVLFALPRPAAPQANPQEDAPLPLCSPRAVVHPLGHSLAGGKLLEDIKKGKNN